MTRPLLATAWLLTPLVVWLGAFLFGWLGALAGERLLWLVVGGLLGGLFGLIGWVLIVLQLKKRGELAPTVQQDQTN